MVSYSESIPEEPRAEEVPINHSLLLAWVPSLTLSYSVSSPLFEIPSGSF